MALTTYETIYVGEQLGPSTFALDLDWAEHVGDTTTEHEFTVETADPTDALVGVQAFDVGTYGHEIVINDEPLSGFDIPPNDGWQYWVDTVTGTSLIEGSNTIRVDRDTDTTDTFAIGSIVVQWKRPGDI
ncbi:MAG: DUF7383 domain-containing protein [Halobacteriota archaeon]